MGNGTRAATDPQSVSNDAKSVGEALFEDTFENWSSIFSTNITSIYFVTAAFLDLLGKGANKQSAHGKSRGTSSVINISSMVGKTHLSLNRVSLNI
jgi:NAD(P)-dependent dehydrogenase (short-subunit alcohol dehydrogenase family)